MKTMFTKLKKFTLDKFKLTKVTILESEKYSVEILRSFKFYLMKQILLFLILVFVLPSLILFPVLYFLIFQNSFTTYMLDLSVVFFFLLSGYSIFYSLKITSELINMFQIYQKTRSEKKNQIFRIVFESSIEIENLLPLQLKIGNELNQTITKELLIKERKMRGNFRYSLRNSILPISIEDNIFIKLNDTAKNFIYNNQFKESLVELNIQIRNPDYINKKSNLDHMEFIPPNDPYMPFQIEEIGKNRNWNIFLQKSTYFNYFFFLTFVVFVSIIFYILVSIDTTFTLIRINLNFRPYIFSRYSIIISSILTFYIYLSLVILIIFITFFVMFTVGSIIYIHHPLPNFTQRDVIGIDEVFIYSLKNLETKKIEISLTNDLNSIHTHLSNNYTKFKDYYVYSTKIDTLYINVETIISLNLGEELYEIKTTKITKNNIFKDNSALLCVLC